MLAHPPLVPNLTLTKVQCGYDFHCISTMLHRPGTDSNFRHLVQDPGGANTRRDVCCADALRVVVYQGQSQWAGIGGRQSAGPVTPRDLAAVDVCITTYDVLRRDLNHRPDEEAAEHALRRRKKYEVRASAPLRTWSYPHKP